MRSIDELIAGADYYEAKMNTGPDPRAPNGNDYNYLREVLDQIKEQLEPVDLPSMIQPAIRPVSMPLFPTMCSLQSVVDLAVSQLPITSANQLTGLLFTYHNTFINQLNKS